MAEGVTPSQRVLIVDGDRYFRETIRDALSVEGVACELAGGGVEARKAIEDPRIACVVLDVRAEKPDALGVLDALLAERPALRVIALAGQGDQELVLEALRRGACDYLAKPVHDEELGLAVARALAAHDALWRWQRLRERLARLSEPGDDAAGALADVFGLARAQAQRALETGAFPDDPAHGDALHDEDRALLRLYAATSRTAADPRPAEASVDAGPWVDMMREIAEAATREIEPERLLAVSLRPAARAASARAAGVFLIDNVTGRLVCEARVDGVEGERAVLPRDRGLTGGCLAAGAVVATDHPERDPRYDAGIDTPESGAEGPLLVVPLRVRGRVLGVARIFPAPEEGASARLAELVAAPLSAATRNVLLYRSLLESVEDVARARREGGGAAGMRGTRG